MSYPIAERLFQIVKKNQSLLQIPTEYKSSDYFPDFVSKKLDDYYAFLKNNEVGKIVNAVSWTTNRDVQFLNRIRPFNDAINNCLKLYYDGKIAKAYEKFNTSLDKIVGFRANTVLGVVEPHSKFYRIRIANSAVIKDRSDNFHIKFELRHICSTQRYSVPGMPSIYLGDSAFICFKEVNSPSFSDAYISLFEAKKLINIIEIQTVDNFFKQYEEENNLDLKLTHILRFLLLFPLYVACTVKVRHEGAFKSEYIIPQFLLQYVTDDETIKGIKFPSTKIDIASGFSDLITHNYVFPVAKSEQSGFCSTLRSFFDLTRPKSFDELLKSKIPDLSIKDYNKSDFRLIETALAKEKIDDVLN